MNAHPISKLHSVQPKNELHVVTFGCSQKVKLLCGPFCAQVTSLVGLNEIRSMVRVVVSPKYSTWQICIVPTSVRRSGKWDIAVELNDTRISKHLSSLHRPTIRNRITLKVFSSIAIPKKWQSFYEPASVMCEYKTANSNRRIWLSFMKFPARFPLGAPLAFPSKVFCSFSRSLKTCLEKLLLI
jgi:hypothetical protein